MAVIRQDPGRRGRKGGGPLNGESIPEGAGISRMKLFLALSRTPHLLVDLAAPSLAAVLALGGFPPAGVLLLGLVTAFAGYSAVYALNDVVDQRIDRSTLASDAGPAVERDLDGIFVRHPLAQGLLNRREALAWTAAWSAAALVGASLLNPVCPLIFLGAALLEVLYCLLLKVTWLRGLVSGLVKTSGPLAAVFAVDPHPSPAFVAVLFFWLFFWEIGGQNVPNDLGDLETDRRIGARTIPVRFGSRGAARICAGSLLIALALSLALVNLLPVRPGGIYVAGALISGFYFLLAPCYPLTRKGGATGAFGLFNRASFYPLSMLVFAILDGVLTASFLSGGG